jgi:endonuclease/exonuclease/phosphatase family metal-dependent hydrolase
MRVTTEQLTEANPIKTHLTCRGPARNRGGLSRRTALVGLLVGVLAAVAPAYAERSDCGGHRDFTTFTANAYVGADIAAPLSLDPNDPDYVSKLIATVTATYLKVVASDPPIRMEGLAREIAASRPEVVGLEEIWTVSQAPATATGPGSFTVVFDFLQLLTNALAAHGLHYAVAASATESDIIMPMRDLQTGGIAYGRITDHEVILARTDLPPGHLRVSHPQSGHFANYLQVPAIGLSMLRGWCSVDVSSRGETFRYVCAHLEQETAPAIQMAQAQELLGSLDHNMPVVLVGDFNADPLHRNGTTTYDAFTQAGFKDAWTVLHPHNPAGGLTWGHDADLADPTQRFVWRLDLVLYRGRAFQPEDLDILDARISRTQAPLWPSDHAAVAVQFDLCQPKAPGHRF